MKKNLFLLILCLLPALLRAQTYVEGRADSAHLKILQARVAMERHRFDSILNLASSRDTTMLERDSAYSAFRYLNYIRAHIKRYSKEFGYMLSYPSPIPTNKKPYVWSDSLSRVAEERLFQVVENKCQCHNNFNREPNKYARTYDIESIAKYNGGSARNGINRLITVDFEHRIGLFNNLKYIGIACGYDHIVIIEVGMQRKISELYSGYVK